MILFVLLMFVPAAYSTYSSFKQYKEIMSQLDGKGAELLESCIDLSKKLQENLNNCQANKN
jgi:ABC-type glycerol-3-phosphate transport system permease component